jgi:hypothetical protein
MKTGLSFNFDNEVAFFLPDALMEKLVPDQFQKGEVTVLFGKKVLGIAGRLTEEQIKSIPKNTQVSLVADIEGGQKYIALIEGVEEMNAELRGPFSRESFFTIYHPSHDPA